MKIDIINVPLFYGCDRPGAEIGPKVLKENGLIDIFKKAGNDVVDKTEIDIIPLKEEDKFKKSKTMKYLDGVIDTNEKLAKEVCDSLNNGRLAFSVGGDHSLGLGSLAGASKANGNDIGVIWIDAHADINTPETSPSGNTHGMPLAASMGYGVEELKDLFYKGRKVNPNNCFILGARSVDDGEVKLIDEAMINVWYADEIHDKGMGIVIKELMEMLEEKNIKDIHISFDIDSLDSRLVPGTGTPVEDGLEYDETKKLIASIIETGKVRSIDFVEFNPKRDKEGITLKSCLTILEAFAKALAKID